MTDLQTKFKFADYSRYTQPRPAPKPRSAWRAAPKHFVWNPAHQARRAHVTFRDKVYGRRKHLYLRGGADLWEVLDAIRRAGGTGRAYKVVYER